jgi:hypothetical protein
MSLQKEILFLISRKLLIDQSILLMQVVSTDQLSPQIEQNQTESEEDLIDEIPVEIWKNIFTFLPLKNFIPISLLSKEFHSMFKEDSFWEFYSNDVLTNILFKKNIKLIENVDYDYFIQRIVPLLKDRKLIEDIVLESKIHDKSIAPKKPLSAYMIYCQQNREKNKLKHPDLTLTEIVKHLGMGWKNLEEEEMVSYQSIANQEKEKYKILYAEYLEKLPHYTMEDLYEMVGKENAFELCIFFELNSSKNIEIGESKYGGIRKISLFLINQRIFQ